ncbi:Hypothetical protein NCS54_00155600 [Fusarium falciforme]|uniref:Hypothetical protein n=1 Tax=Fusarium falciforme TaxID=195108 RepID=UPI002300E2F0|nr:Hypothetical protein NCS54_00155600 [Fusarium falciforme]WAO84346.1 Hypothetical protein NCS54_00155600 [Fusarium falciforme]
MRTRETCTVPHASRKTRANPTQTNPNPNCSAADRPRPRARPEGPRSPQALRRPPNHAPTHPANAAAAVLESSEAFQLIAVNRGLGPPPGLSAPFPRLVTRQICTGLSLLQASVSYFTILRRTCVHLRTGPSNPTGGKNAWV